MLRTFLGVIILSLGLANASAFAAAPLCAQVLITSKLISADKLSKAIVELAQMKMESDLATAKGSVSSEGPLIPMKGLYQKKLLELVFKLRGQETPTSLQNKIKIEIAKLQKTKTDELTRETTERKIEEETLLPFKNLEYNFESHTPFNWFTGRILYHTETDSILLNYAGGLLDRMDLKTELIVRISENAFAAKLLEDEEHVLSFSNKGFIQTHRVDNGVLTSKIPIAADLSEINLNIGEFSPDNSRLVAAASDKITIIDAQTGREIAQLDKKSLPDTTGNILHIEFIDNDSILIRLATDKRFTHQLIRYEISTKTHQTTEISDKAGLAFSQDRRTLFTAYSETILLRSSDLSEISRTTTRGLESRNGNLIRSVPGSDLQLVASTDRTGRPFAYLADVTTDIMAPTFTFSSTYYQQMGLAPIFPKDAIFSNDGKVLIVISEKVIKNTGVSKFTIDKWTIK